MHFFLEGREGIYSILYQKTYFLKVLKILIDGWAMYFKMTRFAAVQA